METGYSWPGIEDIKDRIANPDAYASAGPAAPADEEKPNEEEAIPAEESEAEESGEEGQ